MTTIVELSMASPTVVDLTVTGDSVEVTQVSPTVVEITGVEAAGPRGSQGELGPTGLSAYEVALLEGFVGTEAAWLASLVGADGASGGSYTHTQGVAAATWTITHNLGYRPGGVQTFDSLGREVLGDITHIDVNSLTVTFTAGFSGTAYLS